MISTFNKIARGLESGCFLEYYIIRIRVNLQNGRTRVIADVMAIMYLIVIIDLYRKSSRLITRTRPL